jgi:hypothetical protein
VNALIIWQVGDSERQEALVALSTHVISHDFDKPHNPPPVLAPAMSDDQFAFDNEMDMELQRLSNPLVLAREVFMLRERVKQLEQANNDN